MTEPNDPTDPIDKAGKRPLKILEVVVRFYPYIGGVENTVLDLNRRLMARGHQTRVVCADEPPGSPELVEGIGVVRLPYRRFKIGNTNLCPGLPAALRREKPDLIHGHMPTALFADAAASAAEALDVPFVLTYHNDLIGDGLKGILGGVYNQFILPRLLARADKVITINPSYATKSPHLSAKDPKITCIPWGVDENVFHPPADGGPPSDAPELVLGFLSLLDAHHRYKGLEVLFRAAALLRRDGIRLRLKIGGAGEKQGYYRKMAADLGVGDQAEFLGFIPGPDLTAFYGSCHAFVLPSTDGRREGFGLVLLEAMSCARPVLSTPIVGMSGDIEKYGSGLLAAPGDPAALAAAIRRMHEDRASLAVFGQNGRRLVEERYTWTRVTDTYESLYQAAVAEHKPRR
jgi:glycosyltransferase involved in cell wall biosynthesis